MSRQQLKEETWKDRSIRNILEGKRNKEKRENIIKIQGLFKKPCEGKKRRIHMCGYKAPHMLRGAKC